MDDINKDKDSNKESKESKEEKKNDNGFSKTFVKHDKHDKKSKRHFKKYKYNKYKDKNKNRNDEGRIDYSKYDKNSKSQSLNLEILETARIEQFGLLPLAGKPLPKKDIDIDPYPEVKAIANSATANIATNFATADINLHSEESDTLDYISIQWDVCTYAQLPTPEWNTNNNGMSWVFNGWNNPYETFTTQRAVQLAEQLNLITTSMQTNTAFAGLLALTYEIKAPSGDSNPFWKQYSTLGILGLVDGVNTFMLCAVLAYRMHKRLLVVLDYFIKKHPQFSSALLNLKGMMKIKKMQAILETMKFDLSYFFCDVEWVDRMTRMLTAISKADESIYSPIILPKVVVATPKYQMALANGKGPFFTMSIDHGSLDGTTPYYQNNQSTSYGGQEMDLIQTLQAAVFNAGDPQGINFASALQEAVTEWWETYYNDLVEMSTAIQKFKAQISAYTSFMVQATQAGLINYKRQVWEWDIDIEMKYVPQIALLLKHPEVTMTSSANRTGQFSASIILEGDHVESSLVDSTRWYSICTEPFFLITDNNWNQDMRNYVLKQQFANYNADDENPSYTNAAMAPNNTLTSVYQLPEIAMYNWIEVYMVNGTYARFRQYTDGGRALNTLSRNSDGSGNDVYNELSIRGMWLLSDGSYYVKSDPGTLYGYYLNYGMPQIATSEKFSTWWTSGFRNIVDYLGILSTSSNNGINLNTQPSFVGPYSISQDYTVGILVSMRWVYADMRAETIKRLRVIEPVSPDSVQKMANIPLH